MSKFKSSLEIFAVTTHQGYGRVVIRTKEGEYTYYRSQCIIAYEEGCLAPRMERRMVWKMDGLRFWREMKVTLFFRDDGQRNEYCTDLDD